MSYIDQISTKRIVLVITTLTIVTFGYWSTGWSADYLLGISLGMVIMGLIDYTDESG